MSQRISRAMVVALRARGPMGVKALAAEVGEPWRTVANLCSSMKSEGMLVEKPNERGTMHGRRYEASRDVLWSDVVAVRELLEAYGRPAFNRLIREACSP